MPSLVQSAHGRGFGAGQGEPVLTLDVIVPTYNRSHLLAKAVDSLLRAPVPPGLEVRVVVVDNNSRDDTAAVVERLQGTASLPLLYVRETRQGLSNARNGGLAATDGDLVGFIDDDEEIAPEWYTVVAREFADPAVKFIGGPYLPNWVTPQPHWLPTGYPAVIGALPPKPRAVFNDAFKGNLMGGNAVFRRSVFERVGGYNPNLGRSSKGLLSDEDAEFYARLRAAGMHGLYVPELAIHHYIAPERLTRNYHRRWVYWRAVSQGAHAREVREPVAHLLGIPRYRIAQALRGLLATPRQYLRRRGVAEAFSKELAFWDLLGFLYGKYVVRIGSFYSDAGSVSSAPRTPQPEKG